MFLHTPETIVSKEPKVKKPTNFGRILAGKFPQFKQRPQFVVGTVQGAISAASARRRPLIVLLCDLSQPELAAFLESTVCNPDLIKTLVCCCGFCPGFQ